jgi:hypothetical protein
MPPAGVVTSLIAFFGLTCVGKSDVRVNELVEGSFGLANGFRAGEGPVGGRAEGMRVVMFLTLPDVSCEVFPRCCHVLRDLGATCFWFRIRIFGSSMYSARTDIILYTRSGYRRVAGVI